MTQTNSEKKTVREGAVRFGDSPRINAVHQLVQIEQHGTFIGRAASGDVPEELDSHQERRQTEYVAGITRWRRWLDFIISTYYRGNLERMELTLRQILRLGLYELLFLDTPAHAAVNESVELAKRMVRSQAGGLVNGILRAILRNRESLPEPDTGDKTEDLAIRMSHPSWMVRRWVDRYGMQHTRELLEWNNSRPFYSLRINEFRIDRERFLDWMEAAGVEWEPSPYLDNYIRVRQLQPVIQEGLLEKGWCVVQDESAALVVHVLSPQPGDVMIDGCAAPGGKCLYAADRMGRAGQIVAVDLYQQRLRMLETTAQVQGVQIIQGIPGDLRQIAREGSIKGNRVLVDAPCSGLGVLAKRADLRWNRSPENLDELVVLQDELLTAASDLVLPGGYLVYSTCTIEPEENEERVTAFLKANDQFVVERVDGLVPDSMVTPEGYYATLPFKHGIDGSFAVRFRKAGA